MSTVPWEEVKRRVDEQRRAAGLPVRSAEEKRADMDRLLAEVRAYGLVDPAQDRGGPADDVRDAAQEEPGSVPVT